MNYQPFFYLVKKCQGPKETLNMLYGVFVEITATRMKTFPNFKHGFLIPKPSVKFWFISQPNTHIFEKFFTVLCKELVCLSKKIWKYLSKPIIETEN